MKSQIHLYPCLLVFTLAACGQTQNTSEATGIDVSNSNIASDVDGPITEINILPNTMVPKGVFVSLTYLNEDFVSDLYQIIHDINETENLHGMEGPDQEITLVTLSGDEGMYDDLKSSARNSLGIQQASDVPYLDVIFDSFSSDLWMQDWGEFASVKVEGHDEPVFGVFDSGRYYGRGGIEPEMFSRVFRTPFVALGQDYFETGNSGGNLEATHEGVPYVGDSITRELEQEIREHGNPDLMVLPSEWLYVGHVDEYLSYVPADNSCGAALLYADPLLGLNLAAQAEDQETHMLAVSASSIRDSLSRFRRRGAREGSTRLADYDLSVSAITVADDYVLYNLELQSLIERTVDDLVRRADCLHQTVGLPQLFHAYSSWDEGSAIADAPGVTNSLVLRNHIVVPDPKIASFRLKTRELLADVTGDESTIHFIDTTVYHQREGEVHCGTNVIREHSMAFRY